MDIGVKFVSLARQQALNKNYMSAFKMYIYAIDIYPGIKNEIEKEFRPVFLEMNKELANNQDVVNIFRNFDRVLKIYPDSVDLLNDIGTYLYKHSYADEAIHHFEKALRIDSSLIKVEKKFNSVKRSLFPRNIFRRLNDKMLNDAYKAAIRSCINPTRDNVINIDAGTGLLTLYATECNPRAVTACESSKTMIELAENLMHENHDFKVFIVNQSSLILNHSHIKAGLNSVLLTDMIDAGLFGNYILHSLSRAWKNLLHEESKIIPGKAEFFVVGINCVELNQKYKMTQHAKNILNIPDQNVHTTYFAETYYSEDLYLYENVKYICEPQSLFTIDFNCRDEVNEMLNRQRPYNAVFNPTSDDEMNMVVGWFNLHLTEDIVLTSDPRSTNRTKSWQQAVFFDIVPRKVLRNESFSIPFVPYDGRLTLLQEPGTVIARVSHETLIFLNDTDYMNMITQSIGMVCLHLGQTMSVEQVDIVDLSPFPLFGVLMMKRSANSLTCRAKTRADIAFLNSVLDNNGIPTSKVTIFKSDSWSREVFNNKKFHVIFTNIFDFSGEIDMGQKRILDHLQQSHLTSNGICLPASVTIMGQLVYSNDLEISNRVVDDNVGYRMAKHVNRFRASQLSYLDAAQLDFQHLSEAFEITSCEDMYSKLVTVPILKDGVCNAILCWCRVQLVDGWKVIHTNRRNSFISSTAYMADPLRKVFKDDEVNVLLCVDLHGMFKLTLDDEPY